VVPALQKKAWLVCSLCVLLVGVSTVHAVVLHPDGEPNLLVWTDRPEANVVGRWGDNASCVVIAPNYIITTRHQSGGTDTAVVIGGVTYTIDDMWYHPDNPYPHPLYSDYKVVDLRIVKLHSANLESYVDLYTQRNEISEPDDTVLAGYGLGRKPDGLLQTGGVTYGYQWQDRLIYDEQTQQWVKNNFTQRWGTNRISGTEDNFLAANYNGTIKYNLDLVVAEFNDPNTTLYESSVAEFDSGGGWFINSGGGWKVAGINWGVEHAPDKEAWFRNNIDPNAPDPDKLYSMRISSYADWLISKIDPVCTGPVAGDFNGDCVVDELDLMEFGENWLRNDCGCDNNFCQGSDVKPVDGWVDLVDFSKLAIIWQDNYEQ